MTFPGRRILNFAGFLVCAALMAYALYAQHQLMLEPCPLCVLQRIAVVALGVVFLLAALQNSSGSSRYVYVVLLLLAGLFGTIVAGRHVWLQHLPPDRIPACGPGLDYMLDNFPFRDVLDMVFTGSGECADVNWSFLSLSMPECVLIAIVLLSAGGVWNNLRRS